MEPVTETARGFMPDGFPGFKQDIQPFEFRRL